LISNNSQVRTHFIFYCSSDLFMLQASVEVDHKSKFNSTVSAELWKEFPTLRKALLEIEKLRSKQSATYQSANLVGPGPGGHFTMWSNSHSGEERVGPCGLPMPVCCKGTAKACLTASQAAGFFNTETECIDAVVSGDAHAACNAIDWDTHSAPAPPAPAADGLDILGSWDDI
jgi:hypothetical protein